MYTRGSDFSDESRGFDLSIDPDQTDNFDVLSSGRHESVFTAKSKHSTSPFSFLSNLSTKSKSFLSTAGVVVLLLGLAATLAVVKTSQDVRQQASVIDNCCGQPDYKGGATCSSTPDWEAGYYACQRKECGACANPTTAVTNPPAQTTTTQTTGQTTQTASSRTTKPDVIDKNGPCPAGYWNACGDCLANKCVTNTDSNKTCNVLVKQYCGVDPCYITGTCRDKQPQGAYCNTAEGSVCEDGLSCQNNTCQPDPTATKTLTDCTTKCDAKQCDCPSKCFKDQVTKGQQCQREVSCYTADSNCTKKVPQAEKCVEPQFFSDLKTCQAQLSIREDGKDCVVLNASKNRMTINDGFCTQTDNNFRWCNDGTIKVLTENNGSCTNSGCLVNLGTDWLFAKNGDSFTHTNTIFNCVNGRAVEDDSSSSLKLFDDTNPAPTNDPIIDQGPGLSGSDRMLDDLDLNPGSAAPAGVISSPVTSKTTGIATTTPQIDSTSVTITTGNPLGTENQKSASLTSVSDVKITVEKPGSSPQPDPTDPPVKPDPVATSDSMLRVAVPTPQTGSCRSYYGNSNIWAVDGVVAQGVCEYREYDGQSVLQLCLNGTWTTPESGQCLYTDPAKEKVSSEDTAKLTRRSELTCEDYDVSACPTYTCYAKDGQCLDAGGTIPERQTALSTIPTVVKDMINLLVTSRFGVVLNTSHYLPNSEARNLPTCLPGRKLKTFTQVDNSQLCAVRLGVTQSEIAYQCTDGFKPQTSFLAGEYCQSYQCPDVSYSFDLDVPGSAVCVDPYGAKAKYCPAGTIMSLADGNSCVTPSSCPSGINIYQNNIEGSTMCVSNGVERYYCPTGTLAEVRDGIAVSCQPVCKINTSDEIWERDWRTTVTNGEVCVRSSSGEAYYRCPDGQIWSQVDGQDTCVRKAIIGG